MLPSALLPRLVPNHDHLHQKGGLEYAADHLRAIAVRSVHAEERFLAWAIETAGVSRPEAETAMQAMRRAKVLTIDVRAGQFTFSHGAFADPDVIRRASGAL